MNCNRHQVNSSSVQQISCLPSRKRPSNQLNPQCFSTIQTNNNLTEELKKIRMELSDELVQENVSTAVSLHKDNEVN